MVSGVSQPEYLVPGLWNRGSIGNISTRDVLELEREEYKGNIS